MMSQFSVGQMVQVQYVPGQSGGFQATQVRILPQVGPAIPGGSGGFPASQPGTTPAAPPAPPAPGGGSGF
jgi:hypothetical protein